MTDRRKPLDGSEVFISASEIEVLQTALLERGLSYSEDQDSFDNAEPYDEVAATLNVLIYRWYVSAGDAK
jgi:hypothetical protein